MTRHILHINEQAVPPLPSSGGSNRLVHWLATAQSKLGYKVSVLSPSGHSTEHYDHIKLKAFTLDAALDGIPDTVTDIEYHVGLSNEAVETLHKKYPRLVTIVHAGYQGAVNSVFVSHSHAKRNGQEQFIHNGIPQDDFEFCAEKSDYYLFLAKVKRSKKGVDTAIKLAKKKNLKLLIGGGRRLKSPETWFGWHPKIKPLGYIDGQEKIDYLKKAKALLVPIKWDEPFGLTVVEAMLSGTPVIAFDRGAMSELIVHGETGFLCETEQEFSDALLEVEKLDPHKVREHAVKYFSATKMAEAHIQMLDYAQTHTW